jgi:phosphomannomutase
MKNEAKFSISGLRGIWGDTLNEELSRRHIEAFALFLQKQGTHKIVLGRDTRKSGPIIREIAIDILTKAGIEIVDAGIVPTPTIIFLIRNMRFDGGIMITASHNPPEYNGIKFFTSKAFYINEAELAEIKGYVGMTPQEKEPSAVHEDMDLGIKHVEHVLNNINAELIRSRQFKVVIDTINGTGYHVGPMLLEKLGCDVTVINGTPDGNFAHMPEPLAINLTDLAQKVKEVGADIGFAQDPDADRLVFCDEKGVIVLEEYMLSLCIKNVLEITPGDIVTNLSTSNTNEDLAKSAGYKNYRTKVGEGNVTEGIIKHNAVIGGEGSGGVIYPRINLCRDSLTGMGLILELLARKQETVSEIVEQLPRYESIKTKVPFNGDLQEIIQSILSEFSEGKANTEDGIRIDFPDSSWVQLRASNTEPLVRIWSEAKTKERGQELIDRTKKYIG